MIKHLLPIFAIFLAGCSNHSDKPRTKEKLISEQVDKEMTVSIDSIAFQAQVEIVERTSKQKKDSIELNFASKSFFLTTDYDLTNCNALARCDCCISEIYFKNDSIFIYSTECSGATSYTKGRYIFSNETLTLKHDSLLVINRQPFGEDESELGITTEIRYIEPTNYSIEECGGQVLLHWKGNTNNEYGTEEFQRNSLVYIVNRAEYSEIKQKLKLN